MKFGYTIVYVTSVKETLDFYGKAFGFATKFLHESEEYGELDTGETILAFASCNLANEHFQGVYTPVSLFDKPVGIELGFVTDDVDGAFNQAIDAGALILKMPETKPWGQRVAYVRTPEGTLIELLLSCRVLIPGPDLEAMTTPQAAGPPKGYIIGHGGGNIDKDLVFKERFLDLARGGMDSLVYIPSAFSDEQLAGRQKKHLDPAYAAARFGFVSAAVLHTRDRLTAGSGDFLSPLKTATAVFFTGGRQWRLVDAYLGTKMIDELEKLLARGGVIGGSSAGITALASLLVRGNSSPDDNTILLGDHLEGFGLLSNMAVDQHLLEQGRQDDMLQVVKAYPHVLGVGIDIMTSVIIQGNVMQVCGKSRVAVYDINDSSDTGYIFLEDGESYDLKKRKRLPSV